VPENDSHGEFIFLVSELYRYTHDRSLLAAMWPHVEAAAGYMETLRQSERSTANLAPARRAFYGLLPASISHEGYAAQPMHSYWDDFWALKGYKEAVTIGTVLGHQEATTRLTRQRDEFRHDLYASLAASTAAHGIAYLPGCAELGDFDATSTTIALDPVGEQAYLPQALLLATFERYWQAFVARRDGVTPWDDYTPYELALWGHLCVLVGVSARRHCSTSSLPASGPLDGTNGPKWWGASCASRALWAICHTAGSRPTSCARRSTSSPTNATPIARSCSPPDYPCSG
jgi:hypothetical protein